MESEYGPHPDADPIDPHEVIAAEKRARDIETFAPTLDDDQRAAFEELINPINQMELEERSRDEGFRKSRFGYLPPDTEMTPIQLSVHALIEAYAQDQTAAVARTPELKAPYEQESERLKQLAVEYRKEHERDKG